MKKFKLSTWATIVVTACLANTQVKAENILGIDVSAYQGSLSQADWDDIASGGPTSFAFCRATTGYDYSEDSTYPDNMKYGKDAGILMGAYEFSHLYANTPAQEATYFWNYAGGQIIKDGKSLDPMIDFEVFDGAYGYGSTHADYTAWFNQWSADIKGKTSNFMHPVIYASICNGMCYLTTACTLSQWAASYNDEDLYTGGPWNECTSCNYVDPDTGNGWTYWQVSSTGSMPGISGDVDFDAYPDSKADLEAYQGVGN
jgi:lysozyme